MYGILSLLFKYFTASSGGDGHEGGNTRPDGDILD